MKRFGRLELRWAEGLPRTSEAVDMMNFLLGLVLHEAMTLVRGTSDIRCVPVCDLEIDLSIARSAKEALVEISVGWRDAIVCSGKMQIDLPCVIQAGDCIMWDMATNECSLITANEKHEPRLATTGSAVRTSKVVWN